MNDQEGFLYKYRTIDEGNIDRAKRIFTDNELYFSSSGQFNDPFDSKFEYTFAASRQELRKYFLDRISIKRPNLNRKKRQQWVSETLKKFEGNSFEFERQMRQLSENIISEVGICSLTRTPNDILMWSHYAESHRGFCLKFVEDKKQPFFINALPISYSKEYPIVNPIKDDRVMPPKKSGLQK